MSTKGWTDQYGDLTIKWFFWIAGIIIGAIIALIIFFGSRFIVGQNEVAILKTLGKVQDNVYQPWFNLKIPLVQSVIKYDIRTQKYQSASTFAASRDLQNVTTELAVNYAINGADAVNIYTNLGNLSTVEDRIIYPAIQEVVKQTTSQFNASELITKRSEASAEMTKQLVHKLEKYGIRVVDVNIVDFKFSDWFNDSIEAKVKAEQESITQKNLLEKIKYEAEQKVVRAEAEAEAIRIQADAVKAQWGKEYVQLKWIEARDGRLPATVLGDDTSVLMWM